MKRILLPLMLLVALLAMGVSAMELEAQEKKEDAKKSSSKSSSAKSGSEKSASAKSDSAKTEEAAKPKYSLPKDYEKLMKKLRLYNGILKSGVENLDSIKLKSTADKMKFYSDLMNKMDKDKSKRNTKDDYKKWNKALSDSSKELYDLVSKKKVDWDAVKKSFAKVKASCAACHDKYKPKDD